jgi:hypothetical protein
LGSVNEANSLEVIIVIIGDEFLPSLT